MHKGLQYTIEELHEMHKRVILNGIFSKQRDSGPMIQAGEMEVICDDADRLLKELEDRNMIREE